MSLQYKMFATDNTWLPSNGWVLFNTDDEGALMEMPDRNFSPPPVKVEPLKRMVNFSL
jgi:hypothetical protein